MSTVSASYSTPTAPSTFRASWLRRVILADVVITLISGALLVVLANPIAEWAGLSQPSFLVSAGIFLIAFAVFMGDTVRRDSLDHWRAWAIITVDFSWVVASILLIASNAYQLNSAGNWAVLITADSVLLVGIAKFITFRRYCKTGK